MKTCYFCRGEVAPNRIDYMARRNGGYILIKNLESEVCRQCGEVYLDPKASRQIDKALTSAKSTAEHITVPVVHCP